jgi:hypothetical protein
MQTSNYKLQAPNKFQIPNFKCDGAIVVGDLEFVI